MSKVSKLQEKLESMLLEKLEPLGFKQEVETYPDWEKAGAAGKSRRKATLKMVRGVNRINDETEIFVYPGADIVKGVWCVRLSPVIGVENLILRELSRSSGNSFVRNSNGRVCHIDVSSYDDCRTMMVRPQDPGDEAVQHYVDLIEGTALPRMSRYDSTAKVRILFRSYMMGEWNDGVAMLEPQLKLRLLQGGWD